MANGIRHPETPASKYRCGYRITAQGDDGMKVGMWGRSVDSAGDNVSRVAGGQAELGSERGVRLGRGASSNEGVCPAMLA